MMLNKEVMKIYFSLKKKYWITKCFYIILNLILFLFLAAVAIVSVYALKKNPFPNTKIYFVITTVLSGVLTFISSLISLIKWNQKRDFFANKLKQLKVLEEDYHKKSLTDDELYVKVHELLEEVS